jgi:predicted phosphoribosyltransferase
LNGVARSRRENAIRGAVHAQRRRLRPADRVICLETPANCKAIGQWYEDFSQTTDEEVLNYLDKAKVN